MVRKSWESQAGPARPVKSLPTFLNSLLLACSILNFGDVAWAKTESIVTGTQG